METSISKYFLKNGIVFGIILVFINLMFYLIGIDAYVNNFILFGILILIISITVPVVLTVRYRNRIGGGYVSFKDAFIVTFFVMIIASVVSMIFTMLLYHVIDPEYPKVLNERIIDKTVTLMKNMGSPQDKIDEIIRQSQSEDRFSILNLIKSFLILNVVFAVIALIIAAIVKKTKPFFDDYPTNSN